MSHLVGVSADLLPEAWPDVGPFIESMAANSKNFAASDYAKAIADRNMQLWAVVENGAPFGVGLTELVVYPRRTVCRFVGANGHNAKEWLGHLPSVERWADIQGAHDMMIVCPMGWEFYLRKRGYKRTHVVLEKSLGNSDA